MIECISYCRDSPCPLAVAGNPSLTLVHGLARVLLDGVDRGILLLRCAVARLVAHTAAGVAGKERASHLLLGGLDAPLGR